MNMAKAKTKRDHCIDNDIVYNIGDEWSDHGICNLKICEGGGHISIKVCPQLDVSAGCNRIEGDLNQAFPQCCATLASGDESSSESSSSSSSSDEEEDDLFDDDGEDMDVFKIEEPSSQNVTGAKEEQVVSSNKGAQSETSKQEEQEQNKTSKESNENSSKVYQVNNSSEKFDNVANTMIVNDVRNENFKNTDKDQDSMIGETETAHKNLTNTEKATIDNKPDYSDIRADEKQLKDRLEQNNAVVKSDISENSIVENPLKADKELEETEVKSYTTDVEIKTVVENVNLMHQNVNRDIANVESIDNKPVMRMSSQESMDNINYTALVHELKEEKNIHLLHAMDEQDNSGQYKFTDYIDDVAANDSEFKKTIDFEMDKSSIHNDLSGPNKGNSDLFKITKDSIGQNDVKLRGDIEINESNLTNKPYIENMEKELQGSDEMNKGFYNTEITNGFVYSPEDSEGFLKRPEDNVALQIKPNETITESILDQENISHSVNVSGQPTFNEITDNLTGQNSVEPNFVNTEEIFNKTEEIGPFNNNIDLEESLLSNGTHSLTDLAEVYIKQPQFIPHITDNTNLTEENRYLSTTIDSSNDVTAINTNELGGETNILDDVTKSIIPTIEDPEPIDSFGSNLENHAVINFEDSVGVQEDLMSDRLFQENGYSAETIQTDQITEENYIPVPDYEEVASNEVTEDQTSSSGYFTQSDSNTESTSEKVESTLNSSEDSEEVQ